MMRYPKTTLAIVLVAIAATVLWVLTAPQRLDRQALANVAPGDAAAGKIMFDAGGCAACHAPPKAEGDERLHLAGGLALETQFGTFIAPNISPDPQHGIGQWSFADFANAVMRGVAPDGSHYYPAFPYPSYGRMSLDDVADLYAYMQTLPPVARSAPPSRIGFPFNIRRALGLWKRLFTRYEPIVILPDDAPPAARRGQYLVEGPGHCGACHTPRNALGGSDYEQWLAGAPSLDGPGSVPDITPADEGIGAWSEGDIAYYLESGFTPDFDSVGGAMVEVQENMARLPAADREAIAAYLKVIPAHPANR